MSLALVRLIMRGPSNPRLRDFMYHPEPIAYGATREFSENVPLPPYENGRRRASAELVTAMTVTETGPPVTVLTGHEHDALKD